MLNTQKVSAILQFMSDSGTTISEFLGYIFEDRDFDNHPALQDIKDNIKGILSSLFDHRTLHYPVLQWALMVVNRDHARSIQNLTRTSEGWHFSASNASANQIQDFQLEDMAERMENTTPHLWKTVKGLLSADPKQVRRRSSQDLELADYDDDQEEEEDDAEFWEDAGCQVSGTQDTTPLPDPPCRRKTTQQRERILTIVRFLTALDHTPDPHSTPAEGCMHHQYHDAKYESEVQPTSKRLRHFLTLLQHPAKGRPVVGSPWMFDICQYHQ